MVYLPFVNRFVAAPVRRTLENIRAEYEKQGWNVVWTPTRECREKRLPLRELKHMFEPVLSKQTYALKLSVLINKECKSLFRWIQNSDSKLWVDAEDDARYHRELMRTYVLLRIIRDIRPRSELPSVYFTVQTYRKDAHDVLGKLLERSATDGLDIGIKLVRGAYRRDPAVHWTQKIDTDRTYDACMETLLRVEETHRAVPTVFATHNSNSIERVIRRVPYGKRGVSIAQLRGFETTEWISRASKQGVGAELLVPYGTVRDSVPYLIRRARENTSMWYHLRWFRK